jgi:metal-sulfur cluster biosynthetic enzyme
LRQNSQLESEDMVEEKTIWKTLETVMDPEIDLNVVDLGLIYDVSVTEGGKVHITMTLTTKGCPLSQTLTTDIEKAVSRLPGVTSVKVDIVWDPPWNPRMMSLEAQKKIGKLAGALKAWEKY